jgi:hypothetical protein
LSVADCFMLHCYLIAWLAQNVVLMIFICTENPTLIGRVRDYHISRALTGHGAIKCFEQTRKKIHLVASELGHHKRLIYWTQPPPMGIAGVHWTRLVDTDESYVYAHSANREGGSVSLFVLHLPLTYFNPPLQNAQVRQTGSIRGGEKWTLFLAIRPFGVLCYWLIQNINTNDHANSIWLQNFLFARLPCPG